MFFLVYNYTLPSNSQDLVSNSPYGLLSSSCDVSLGNLVLGQLVIPKLIFFFTLINCLLDVILILSGEILSLSLMRAKGLSFLPQPELNEQCQQSL